MEALWEEGGGGGGHEIQRQRWVPGRCHHTGAMSLANEQRYMNAYAFVLMVPPSVGTAVYRGGVAYVTLGPLA